MVDLIDRYVLLLTVILHNSLKTLMHKDINVNGSISVHRYTYSKFMT